MRYSSVMKKYHKMKNHPMKGHRLYKKQAKIQKKAYLALVLFVVLASYYVLELLNIVASDYLSDVLMAIAAVLFLLLPLYHIHKKTTHKLLLTHDALALQKGFRQFKLLFIDDIKKVKLSKKDTLKIKTDKQAFKIKIPKYSDNLNILKDIMNCEGHFKNKKRPYKLFFEVDGVEIQELTPKINPETSRLIQAYHKEFKHVTPGFIEDILLYNTTVEKVRFLQDRHAVFYLSHIDLKADFPENTHFEAMQTDDAMMLFKDVSHVEIFSMTKHDSNDVQLLGTSISTLRKISQKATIMETNFKPLEETISCDMIFMQGAKKMRVKFVFKDIISGFNQLTTRAWFEKK